MALVAEILKIKQPREFAVLAAFCQHDGSRWTRRVIELKVSDRDQREPVAGGLRAAL